MKKNTRNERKFNINKYWRNVVCFPEAYKCKNSYYWYDKSIGGVVGMYCWLTKLQKSKIDQNNGKRFVLLPQYVSEDQYKDLVKELNNPIVTAFFDQAKDEEDAHFRYRCFVDWNVLNHSEWYRTHLIVKDILFKWCNDNDIKYSYKEEPAPPNYIYDGRDLSNIHWNIDWDEINQNDMDKNR